MGRVRSWAQIVGTVLRRDDVPELWPELAPILEAERRFGRDFAGNALYQEREQWLDRNGIDSAEAREIFNGLFDAIAAGRADGERTGREG